MVDKGIDGSIEQRATADIDELLRDRFADPAALPARSDDRSDGHRRVGRWAERETPGSNAGIAENAEGNTLVKRRDRRELTHTQSSQQPGSLRTPRAAASVDD
jgi:hypothetical protein